MSSNSSSTQRESSPKEEIKKKSKKKKRRKRSFGRRLYKLSKKFLTWLATTLVPHIYMAYMYLLWRTSKVVDETNPKLDKALKNPPHKFIAVLWHQDVMFVAFAFRRLHGTTIASVGRAGELISRMLKLCNFTVFRGGSSKKRRRRTKILDEFVDHMKEVNRIGVGITVDGASGPVYRMKKGAAVMAMKTGIPIYTVRVWCKNRILLPTWDKTLFPLPFNRIHILCEGPFPPPEGIREEEETFEEYHEKVEEKLLDLAYRGFQSIDGEPMEELVDKFPHRWEPPEKREGKK